MECCKYSSPLGEIVIAAEGGNIKGLWFTGQKYDRAGLTDELWTEPTKNKALSAAVDWLDEYFSGNEPKTKLRLSPNGTEFQKKVWGALLDIPWGATVSYAGIAEKTGCKSPRAVGSAVGRNPISLIIPCHRVVGSGGKLTGYAGGLDRKLWLLRHENTVDAIDKSGTKE